MLALWVFVSNATFKLKMAPDVMNLGPAFSLQPWAKQTTFFSSSIVIQSLPQARCNETEDPSVHWRLLPSPRGEPYLPLLV